MCIICKIRQAGISEEALEMVESLAEFAVVASNGLARLKAEEELGLLAGRVMFEQRVAQEGEAEEAPEGLPVEVWQAMPPELREIIRGAITKGAKLQVVSLSDMMADESITKH
jgi:hypothetical protein